MKKIISILLSVILVLSVGTVSVGVQAKAKKSTYIATDNTYEISAGSLVIMGSELHFVSNDMTTKKLAGEYPSEFVTSVYSKDCVAYYVTHDENVKNGVSYPTKYWLKSIELCGFCKEHKAVLHESKTKINLLGGYGNTTIFHKGKAIYQLSGKTVKKLFATKKSSVKYNDYKIFNGKIYFDSKEYSLKTKKTKKLYAKQKVSTNNNLFYVDKSGNLKRLNKNGKTYMVDKVGTIKKVYYANDYGTVVYEKKNKNLYACASGKAKKLGKATGLLGVTPSSKNNYQVTRVKVQDKRVYLVIGMNPKQFNDYWSIVSIKTDGTDKLIHIKDYYDEIDIYNVKNKNIKYCIYNSFHDSGVKFCLDADYNFDVFAYGRDKAPGKYYGSYRAKKVETISSSGSGYDEDYDAGTPPYHNAVSRYVTRGRNWNYTLYDGYTGDDYTWVWYNEIRKTPPNSKEEGELIVKTQGKIKLLGGFGTSTIFVYEGYLYKHNGVTRRLLEVGEQDVTYTLKQGKVYFGDKIFDLSTYELTTQE